MMVEPTRVPIARIREVAADVSNAAAQLVGDPLRRAAIRRVLLRFLAAEGIGPIELDVEEVAVIGDALARIELILDDETRRVRADRRQDELARMLAEEREAGDVGRSR